MHNFFFQIAIFIYFVSTIGFFMQVITLRKDVERIATIFLGAGFGLHTISLLMRWLAGGHPPFVNLYDSLSFLAWAIVGLFLLFQWQSKLKSFGAFVVPLAMVIMTGSSLQSKAIVPLPPALRSIWLPIHAIICLCADAIFALAACGAVMFLIQERQIKNKRLGAIFQRLPSLEALDSMNRRCLTWGFPLLTLGIVTGSIWAEEAWGSYWSWDPKETWSLITWFIYAALLHQRLTVGWRGRKAAIMTLVGFAVLIFTFLGVSLLLSGAHSYATWFK